jgi:hypothetical protein
VAILGRSDPLVLSPQQATIRVLILYTTVGPVMASAASAMPCVIAQRIAIDPSCSSDWTALNGTGIRVQRQMWRPSGGRARTGMFGVEGCGV